MIKSRMLLVDNGHFPVKYLERPGERRMNIDGLYSLYFSTSKPQESFLGTEEDVTLKYVTRFVK